MQLLASEAPKTLSLVSPMVQIAQMEGLRRYGYVAGIPINVHLRVRVDVGFASELRGRSCVLQTRVGCCRLARLLLPEADTTYGVLPQLSE